MTQEDWLQGMIDCDGLEVHKEDWPVVQQSVDAGKAQWVSTGRGPGNAFKRVVALYGRRAGDKIGGA